MKKPKHIQFAPWRERMHEIIFEADTKMGKLFDVVLLVMILASVVTTMLESVSDINKDYGHIIANAEWVFTIAFTIEYILRLICVHRPLKYATSFFGIIDLLAILPGYLQLLPFFDSRTGYVSAVRAMRLVRVFRVFKLAKFLKESKTIMDALKASRPKITVFLTFILMLVVMIGSVMYFVEGGQKDSGFTSIPRSIYWAVVTLTTVGYGDIAPTTALGQFLAGLVMIMGYGVLAVPTGIVSAEIVGGDNKEFTTIACKSCASEGHDIDAIYCKYCGAEL
ncbi:MAG: ion transporter [Saprospiraceae bacterium]|nr:ion transporter [Saprospiraceae bacterium]